MKRLLNNDLALAVLALIALAVLAVAAFMDPIK